MPSQHQHSSASDDASRAVVPPDVREFVRDRGLHEDFSKYYEVIERNFPDSVNVRFKISQDVEDRQVVYIETIIDLRPEDERVMLRYDQYLDDFCAEISHDSQPYFTLSFNMLN